MSPLIVHSGVAAINLAGPYSTHSHSLFIPPQGAGSGSGQGVYVIDPATGQTIFVAAGTFYTLSNGTVVSGGSNPYANPTRSLPAKELPTEKREMPVVGYRAWNWTQKFKLGYGIKGRLFSTAFQTDWKGGQETAFCMGGSGHPGPAPDPNCACGLYVLANMDELDDHVSINDSLVVGAVVGWGKVIQHGREGWRAQYARILALLDCKFSDAQLKNTREAAKEYKVPVMERDGLERYVREWGDPFAEPVTPALTEGRST